MTTWKSLLPLSLLLILALLLYPHPTLTSSKKTTLTLWLTPTVGESTRTAVEEFERLHPEYQVQIGAATVRDMTSDPTRFLLGTAGGDPPDVIYFDRYAVIEWAARGAFTDLNPYLQKDATLANGVHPQDFYDPLWLEGGYHGKQFAIPRSVDIRALFLNEDLLTRAGLVDSADNIIPPKSWEDILRKKFHGTGSVTQDGQVQLGDPLTLPSVGPYPVSPGTPRPNDVATFRLIGDKTIFRARIKSVASPTSFTLDFSRELAPGTSSVPSQFLNNQNKNLEIKIFDADSYTLKTSWFDQKGNLDIAGFTPMMGNSWLYFYAIQNHAAFLSDDGTKILLDAPEVKVALQFMVDAYDALGGFSVVKDFTDSQLTSAQDPFLAGKISMYITGNWLMSSIAAFKPDLRFSLVPAPLPESRVKQGDTPFTWAGGWSFAIPATAHHKDAAWELIRFLTSDASAKIVYDVQSANTRAVGQTFLPDLPARKTLIPFLRQNFLNTTSNPALNDRLIKGYNVFTELLPTARFRPHTPVGQKLWEAQQTASQESIEHAAEVHESLTARSRWVQENLDRYLHPPTGPIVQWKYLIAAYVFLLGIFAALLARAEILRRRAGFARRHWKSGFLCVSPWLTGFVIFSGGPILFSLIISFCRYDAINPAQFVGLSNYAHLLGFHTDLLTSATVPNDPYFWKSLANTAFMLIALPISITLGLFLAMLLNHEFKGVAFFRTAFYLPHVIPALASFLLWIFIFDPSRGLLNRSLMLVGFDHPPNWLAEAAWSKPALILMGLWGIGGGMLIWLAGLKAIPTSLYEAAEIDGAGPLRQFTSVTFPMLSPYIFFNTVMGIIGTLQVFEAAYVMTDGGPSNSTLFYCYYLFNHAFRYLDMGTASAMAWILFALVLALTLLQLRASKKWVHYD